MTALFHIVLQSSFPQIKQERKHKGRAAVVEHMKRESKWSYHWSNTGLSDEKEAVSSSVLPELLPSLGTFHHYKGDPNP